MGILFTGNVLDEYALNKDKFEACVGLGRSKAEMRKLFCLGLLHYAGEDISNIDVLEYAEHNAKRLDQLLDKWCVENYHMPFATVYELLQIAIVNKYEEAMADLAVQGHSKAIDIMEEVIRKKETNNVVAINFINNLPEETEDDKLNDE